MTKNVRLTAGRRIRHSCRRRAGFTLVATLLLTFLIISLLVALMSVVLVETRVIRNQMKQMRARSFAMNGVYSALSRLHDYNGLDWRATATAGLLDTDPATPEIEGVENPWLSGVWQGRGLSSAEQKEKPIIWLTSGAKSYPSRAPELNVSSDPAPASDDKQEPVTPQTKLPDPGPDSDTIWLLRKPAGEDPKLSVKARMIPFKTSRPFRSADPDKSYVIGHYAWWAADEGVKARVNLPLPEFDPAQPAARDDRQTLAQWRLAAPQRAGRLMTGFEKLPSDQENLRKVLTFAQIPLLAGGDGGALIPALEKRWHDVTADSHSLITNSRDGGVKIDLSLLFEMDDEERGQYASDMGGLATMLDFYQTWKKVRARTTRPALDAQPFAVKPADNSKEALAIAANTWLNTVSGREPASAHQCLFSPVVVRMSHAFSVQAKSAPPREIEGPDRKLVLVLDPLVTLWNPYNIILELDAFRIDAWLPSTHLVVEKRDPWKSQRFYQLDDEVWHNAKLYRAAGPSIGAEPGNEPDPETARWQPLARDWSLGTDIEPSEVLENHRSNPNQSPRPRLLLLQSKDNPQTRLALKPGEMLTFSLNSGQIITHTSGSVNLTLEPGWNAEGGVSFDHLADNRHPLRTPDQLLRLYADSEVRVTLEPARDESYAAADPFAFVASYAAEGLAPQDVTTTPQAWRESIGYRDGGGAALEDYSWAGTRTGRGPEFSHRVRAYSGQEGGKPLPGMSGVLKIGQDITPDAKKFLGVIDWHMKSAENADFPAAMLAHFDPRAVIVRHPGRGYPATLPHYQIKARRITAGDEVPGTIKPLTGADSTHAPLFEVPTAPLISMGQLQHFPWQGEAAWLTGFSGYTMGNSWASPWVPRNDSDEDNRIDASYVVNGLFDQFFFSSITPRPDEQTVNGRLAAFLDSKLSKPLPNPRMKFLLDYGQRRKDLLSALTRPLDEKNNPVPPFRRVAASLLIEGGFNVNSTSIEAWKAVLGSLHRAKVPTFDSGVSMEASFGSPLPRLTLVNGPSNTPQDWRGYRSLTSAEIETLATEIVREVKTRGPFVNLGDFINRRLTDDETGKKGALQAAIDRSGINRAFENPQITRQQLDDAAALGTAAGMDWSFPHPDHLAGPVAAAAPGFLTQADILQALAPHLVTRSDTYKIRAYGDVVHPLSGRLEARAWVEVIVQRMPDYVNYPNKDEPPEERRADPAWQQTHALHNVSNRVYGRRWRVVRVRWLSAEEV